MTTLQALTLDSCKVHGRPSHAFQQAVGAQLAAMPNGNLGELVVRERVGGTRPDAMDDDLFGSLLQRARLWQIHSCKFVFDWWSAKVEEGLVDFVMHNSHVKYLRAVESDVHFCQMVRLNRRHSSSHPKEALEAWTLFPSVIHLMAFGSMDPHIASHCKRISGG